MPDIAMCQNDKCPKSKNCRRFTAKPGEWQSYMDFKPDEKGECYYFLPEPSETGFLEKEINVI